VAIWTIKMDPYARFTIPPGTEGSSRTLYFFRGSALHLGGQSITPNTRAQIRADIDAVIANGEGEGEILLLPGQTDRRTRRAVRTLCDELACGNRAGIQRLSAHRLRRIAVGDRRSGIPTRGRPPRKTCRRPRGARRVASNPGTSPNEKRATSVFCLLRVTRESCRRRDSNLTRFLRINNLHIPQEHRAYRRHRKPCITHTRHTRTKPAGQSVGSLILVFSVCDCASIDLVVPRQRASQERPRY